MAPATYTAHIRLIKSDIAANSNKHWLAWLMPNGDVQVEHGRVGSSNRVIVHPGRGRAYYESKIREKLNKGYKEAQVLENSSTTKAPVIQRNELKEVAKRDIGNGNKIVEKLIESLVEENIHMIEGVTTITYNRATGTFSTPLGLITPHAISLARTLLDRIEDLRQNRNFTSGSAMHTLEEYLMLIPQKVGRKLDPEEIFGTPAAMRKQYDVLDALQAALQPTATTAPAPSKTTQDRVFNVTMEVATIEEFRHVRDYFHRSKNVHHRCTKGIDTVYRINIETMHQEFQKVGQKIGNIKELWHGTKNANVLSILKGGYHISPPRTVSLTAQIYGRGVYFADQSSKSLGYIDGGTWNRMGKKSVSYMFLNDIALGTPHIPKNTCPHLTQPPRGCHSLHAKGGYTSGVLNDEFIVFNTAQINPKFLITCVDGGK